MRTVSLAAIYVFLGTSHAISADALVRLNLDRLDEFGQLRDRGRQSLAKVATSVDQARGKLSLGDAALKAAVQVTKIVSSRVGGRIELAADILLSDEVTETIQLQGKVRKATDLGIEAILDDYTMTDFSSPLTNLRNALASNRDAYDQLSKPIELPTDLDMAFIAFTKHGKEVCDRYAASCVRYLAKSSNQASDLKSLNLQLQMVYNVAQQYRLALWEALRAMDKFLFLKSVELAAAEFLIMADRTVPEFRAGLASLMSVNQALIQAISQRRAETMKLIGLLRRSKAYPEMQSNWWVEVERGISSNEFVFGFNPRARWTEPTTEIDGAFRLGTINIQNLVSGVAGPDNYSARIVLKRQLILPSFYKVGLLREIETSAPIDIAFGYSATTNSTGDPVADADLVSFPGLGVSFSLPESASKEVVLWGQYESPPALVGVSTRHLSGVEAPEGDVPFLPAPSYSLSQADEYEGRGGAGYLEYNFDINNQSDFAPELFNPSPHLDPCGANTEASRSWLHVLDQAGNYVYGFCALTASSLGDVWCGLAADNHVTALQIEMLDRETGRTVRSQLMPTADNLRPTFQPDLWVGDRWNRKGANVYGTKKSAVLASLNLQVGNEKNHLFGIQNDGGSVASLTIQAPRSLSGMTLSYWSEGNNVTEDVVRGLFTTPELQPLQAVDLEVRVIASRPGRSTFRLTSKCAQAPWRYDSLAVSLVASL